MEREKTLSKPQQAWHLICTSCYRWLFSFFSPSATPSNNFLQTSNGMSWDFWLLPYVTLEALVTNGVFPRKWKEKRKKMKERLTRLFVIFRLKRKILHKNIRIEHFDTNDRILLWDGHACTVHHFTWWFKKKIKNV